jgi:hypothetical protein
VEKMNFILLDDGFMKNKPKHPTLLNIVILRVASILAAAVLYPLLFDLRKW